MKGFLIVEGDGHLIVNRDEHGSEEIERAIQRFADHTKTVGSFEHYMMTSLSIWNALSSGMAKQKLEGMLLKYSTFPLPHSTLYYVRLWLDRYDKLKLKRGSNDQCVLEGDTETLERVYRFDEVRNWASTKQSESIIFSLAFRGELKQFLVRQHFNIIDECGFEEGERLPFSLLTRVADQTQSFELRHYQRRAIAAFHRDRIGGSGVIVLPCGTGKTVTGIGVMASLQCETLIVTSNMISCEQWQAELLQKTTLGEQDIGIYGGNKRDIRAVTITTYPMLSYRQAVTQQSPHMVLFNKRKWGLVIYDEVHLLPAPIFRMTASIQATRRLGLTATLLREDGCAPDVFALVGAKLYDFTWKEAEEVKAIAKVSCVQLHVPLTEVQMKCYKGLTKREQFKFASTNEYKLMAIKQILNRHQAEQVLIIGQYISQLTSIAAALHAPLVTGETSSINRQEAFEHFKQGHIKVLVLSKIANLALDLPTASVAIQVSGSYGSRQEETQRVGRVVRPKQHLGSKDNTAYFYSLISKHTIEEQFALKRGQFLEDQGYTYKVVELKELGSREGEFV